MVAVAVAVAGLPVVPTLSCPPTAVAVGVAGLGPACQVASGARNAVGSAASSAAGFGVNSILDAIGKWVSDGATWLLGQIGSVIATSTSIDLGADWFTAHYEIMVALAGVVIVPILLLGIMQSIYRQNVSTLVRSVLVNVPLAILLTAVAVKLVQIGLAITDDMSATIAHGAGLDGGHFLGSVAKGLAVTVIVGPGTPAFVVLLGGLAVALGALMVWVELLIRAAAVYVAVLFLPLALASLAWPAIAHWCRRLVDTLVALVLSKFVIVAVLSLAAGALAGGTGSAPAAAGSGPGGSGGGFTAVLGGAALLLFAALAPWALFRLLPFLEAGAVGHLESVSHRAKHSASAPVSAPVKGLAQMAMRSTGTALSDSMGGLLKGAGAGGGAGRVGSIGSSGLAGLGGGARPGAGVGGAEPGPGGDGPQGTRPDPGPSSAESTGVGTTEAPGHAIPSWAVHPEASAVATGGRPGGGSDGGTSVGDAAMPALPALPALPVRQTSSVPPAGGHPGSGVGHVTPLPRQTAALHVDSLGRDELGVRLITTPIKPEGSSERRPSGPDGGGNRGS